MVGITDNGKTHIYEAVPRDNMLLLEMDTNGGSGGRQHIKCCLAGVHHKGNGEDGAGCGTCGSVRLKTGCFSDSRTAGEKGCCLNRERGPTIWCPKCLINGWCSKKCRKKNIAYHNDSCDVASDCLELLGLSSVCYTCGASENTPCIKLALCRLCKVAKYCSKECQKDDWEKNHKKACKAYRNNP